MIKTLVAITSWLFALATSSCVPDYPERLLSDAAVLEHPSVVAALQRVEQHLSTLYINTTRDGLSFAVVHASSRKPVFTFNNGPLKFNETDDCPMSDNSVTSDSVFRIMSVSKNIAMLSALVLGNHPNSHMTLDTALREVLPSFRLPPLDWNSGGSEITLRMLASHTAGIPRESYSTGFNMVRATGRADAATIGAAWAAASAEQVIEGIGDRQLMFAPGERAAYSNAGISLLGSAVASHYNRMTASDISWSELVTQEILQALNMTHSFFGPVPSSLFSDVSVPGGENWVDLIVGSGYDAAAGMWSSVNDLSTYLHRVWLSLEPSLITPFQRRQVLRPVYALPDGKQQVGPGWEIQVLKLSTDNSSTSASTKQYSIFGKAGDGGGWHSWIDVIPNLGYGIIILSQQSGLNDFAAVVPTQIRDEVHDMLAPAFAEALASRMAERLAGVYKMSQDTGLITDEVATSTSNETTYARLEVQGQILYVRELIVNGTSALEAVDKLSWTADAQPRYFSTPAGVVLEPAEGKGETAEFGQGAQIWRMIFPGLKTCDWYDWDGYSDMNGWPLSKFVLVEQDGRVDLHYPPFDILLVRE